MRETNRVFFCRGLEEPTVSDCRIKRKTKMRTRACVENRKEKK